MAHALWWQVYPLGFTGAAVSGDPTGAATGDVTGAVTGPADRHPDHRLGQLTAWLDYAVELGASGLALGPIFASATHGYDTTDYFRIDPRLGDAADFTTLVEAAHQRGLRVLLDGVFNHVGREFGPFRRALLGGPDAPESRWFRLRWDGAGEPDYDRFEGHSGLVALNHDEPAVADHVVEVMSHWLAAGVDGWRLDAAYAVPTAFWASVLPRVRADYPDAYFVGEVIHGDYAEIVSATGLDSLTQYELWKAVWSSLNDGNLFELAHALTRHDGYLEHFVPFTFIGNHDVTRIASKLADPELLPLAVVVLLTVPGTPSVYYGDEQAYRGIKYDRVGGDDEVRPAMPVEGPGALSELGRPTYRLHQQLIGLRRRHSWLHRARLSMLHVANTSFGYECRAGQDRLVVLLNAGVDEVTVEVPGLAQILAGSADLAGVRVTVPARGWVVLA